MLHALICTDTPGHRKVRVGHGEAYISHLRADPHVLPAGGLVDADGAMPGWEILLETDERAYVGALVTGDPYGGAGRISAVRIEARNRTVDGPAGG